jgi:hypothetical protein
MEQHNDPMGRTEPKAPDTFLATVRTTLWTADGGAKNEHVVQEIVLPDEDEGEHSTPVAFLNAVLFLLLLGAFLFCFFETGFLKYLLH